jgi:hypothetical protein
MAISQNPLTGRTKGAFANAVFSKWKGRNTVRSKALEVHNPRTDAQMRQRSKFAFVLAIAQTMGAVIRVGFNEVAQTISEFNAFMKENLSNGSVHWSGTEWVLVPSELVFSKGSLDPTAVTSVASVNANPHVIISYSSSATGNQSTTDQVVCSLGNGVKKGTAIATADRASGSVTVTLDANAATGDVYDGYLFFISADGSKVSDSVYFSETV